MASGAAIASPEAPGGMAAPGRERRCVGFAFPRRSCVQCEYPGHGSRRGSSQQLGPSLRRQGGGGGPASPETPAEMVRVSRRWWVLKSPCQPAAGTPCPSCKRRARLRAARRAASSTEPLSRTNPAPETARTARSPRSQRVPPHLSECPTPVFPSLEDFSGMLEPLASSFVSELLTVHFPGVNLLSSRRLFFSGDNWEKIH